MNKERLLKLADFLETLPPRRFDYSRWVGADWKGAQNLSCGTTACARGWGVVLFGKEEGVTFRRSDGGDGYQSAHQDPYPWNRIPTEDSMRAAHVLFDVNNDEFEFLFIPGDDEEDGKPDGAATASQVAAHIRQFIAAGGIY